VWVTFCVKAWPILGLFCGSMAAAYFVSYSVMKNIRYICYYLCLTMHHLLWYFVDSTMATAKGKRVYLTWTDEMDCIVICPC
jgi:hypothetical protein